MCLRALDPPTNLAAVRAPAGTGVNVGVELITKNIKSSQIA